MKEEEVKAMEIDHYHELACEIKNTSISNLVNQFDHILFIFKEIREDWILNY